MNTKLLLAATAFQLTLAVLCIPIALGFSLTCIFGAGVCVGLAREKYYKG